MTRSTTEIMAIGAILAGAAIGATGTLAIVGNPFDHPVRTDSPCQSTYVSSAGVRTMWTYWADHGGEVRKRKCRTIAMFVPQTSGLQFDALHQAQLEALADELAEARSRDEVTEALERAQSRNEATSVPQAHPR